MGFLKTSTIAGSVVLIGVGGALALTNPSPADYELYATDELIAYLQQDICPKAPAALPGLADLLQEQCVSLLENNQAAIQQLVARNTARHNYVFFSIYQTQLAVPEIAQLPAYEFGTLGVLQKFYTFKAEAS